jgi:membrane protease YdiL (CAAX protease family)
VGAPLLIVFAALALSLLRRGVSLDLGLSALYDQLGKKIPPEALAQLHQKLDHSPLAIPGVWPLAMLGQVLFAGITINTIAAFGEELGWRGFLLKELAPLGFWRASLVIGIIWGVWHWPLIAHGYNYPGHPIAGPLMMTLLSILLAPLLSYFAGAAAGFWFRRFFTAPSMRLPRSRLCCAAAIRAGRARPDGPAWPRWRWANLVLWFVPKDPTAAELQMPALPATR